jgi:hypothetical protein
MHIVAHGESEVRDLMREGLSFLIFTEASITRFNSSALVLNFTTYNRDFIYPQRL